MSTYVVERNWEVNYVDVGKIKKIYIGVKADKTEIEKILKLAHDNQIKTIFMKENRVEYKVVEEAFDNNVK